MIVKTGEADRFAARPPKTLIAALVFGPDQGLVRERADALAKSVVDDLADPFRVAEFEDDALVADPARLSDEAASISMLGGRRVIRVRGGATPLAKIFERFLDAPSGDALIVVEAGDLPKTAPLRKLFESTDEAAAIACYPDSAQAVEEIVRSALKAEGFAVAQDALALMVDRLGSDRGVTRQELEKLKLYAQGEKTITPAHVHAVMGDESELRLEEACDAAASGDYPRLDNALARLWLAGTSPVQVLRQAMGHFQRLLAVRAESDSGGDIGLAIKKLRPPVHFARATAFRAQATRFTQERLHAALALLYEAEALTKTTAVPAEAACGRALLSVAALARARV